jgi:hypothetical protein
MTSTRARSLAFYVVASVVMVVMVTKSLHYIVPARFNHEINDEVEAFPIAIVFCAYVQYLWPSTVRRSVDWFLAAAIAAASWVVAWVLLNLSVPTNTVTLNESFVAIGAMVLYACLPRPISWGLPLGIVLIMLVIVLNHTHFVSVQAESMIPIALMPIAFDWADRSILDPTAVDTPQRRLWWCVFLVAVPAIARLHVNLGSAHDIFHYERRATEGFLALLLIHFFFSYWLGSRWRDRRGVSSATRTGAAAPVSHRRAKPAVG